MTRSNEPWRRARRRFFLLVLIAVLAAGSLSASVVAQPGAATGLRVAGSGLVLVTATALAARVLIVLERARRHDSRARRVPR